MTKIALCLMALFGSCSEKTAEEDDTQNQNNKPEEISYSTNRKVISKDADLEITITSIPTKEQAQINGIYNFDDHWRLCIPYIKERIYVKGLTCDEIAQKIEKSYIDNHFFIQPEVIVRLRPIIECPPPVPKYLTIVGTNAKSERLVYKSGMQLHEALATSDITQSENYKAIMLRRNGKEFPYDLTKEYHRNLKVYPNDIITIIEPE